MHLPKYVALANESHASYEFYSLGPKGKIKKVVSYIEIRPGIFNLGFGDWDEVLKDVKDNVSTNNEERSFLPPLHQL